MDGQTQATAVQSMLRRWLIQAAELAAWAEKPQHRNTFFNQLTLAQAWRCHAVVNEAWRTAAGSVDIRHCSHHCHKRASLQHAQTNHKSRHRQNLQYIIRHVNNPFPWPQKATVLSVGQCWHRSLPSKVQCWKKKEYVQWAILAGWDQLEIALTEFWYRWLGDRKGIWPVGTLCNNPVTTGSHLKKMDNKVKADWLK